VMKFCCVEKENNKEEFTIEKDHDRTVSCTISVIGSLTLLVS